MLASACTPRPAAKPVEPHAERSAGGAATPPAAEPAQAPPPRQAAADAAPRHDGRDLIETPEQSYEREHGSCDYRSSDRPSPLDAHETPDLLIVARHGGSVLSPSNPQAIPAPLAQVAAALAHAGEALSACLPPELARDSAATAGWGPHFRLTPAGRSGRLRVALATQGVDLPWLACMEQRLGALLRDVRAQRALLLAVTVPDAAVPESQRAIVIDKAVIRATIHRNIEDVRLCYERALEVWPSLFGTIVIRFAISTDDGRVLDAVVHDDAIGKRALACCIARHVYGWSFPALGQRGFAVVTYPFVLESVVE